MSTKDFIKKSVLNTFTQYDAPKLALALLTAGVLSLLLVLYSEKGKLFRRLHPPGTPRPIVLEH